jgi:hypothetical protein
MFPCGVGPEKSTRTWHQKQCGGSVQALEKSFGGALSPKKIPGRKCVSTYVNVNTSNISKLQNPEQNSIRQG